MFILLFVSTPYAVIIHNPVIRRILVNDFQIAEGMSIFFASASQFNNYPVKFFHPGNFLHADPISNPEGTLILAIIIHHLGIKRKCPVFLKIFLPYLKPVYLIFPVKASKYLPYPLILFIHYPRN